MALYTRTNPRPTLGATRARQGRLGRPVLWVLLAALLLVVLGFFATWTWKARDLTTVPPNTVQRPADAQAFNAPAPAAASRQTEATPPQAAH